MPIDWRRARRWWVGGVILAAIGCVLIWLSVGGRTIDMTVVGIILLIAGSAMVALPLGFDD